MCKLEGAICATFSLFLAACCLGSQAGVYPSTKWSLLNDKKTQLWIEYLNSILEKSFWIRKIKESVG